MKVNYLFYTFLFLICVTPSISQNINLCGTDLVMKRYIETYRPNYKKPIIDNISRHSSHNNNTKIIPVVFHIIHNGHLIGEEENISPEQIEDAMRLINEDFNAINEDLDNVISEFINIVGDADVEFRLAQRDPEGNCTSGITRTFSEMTNQANDCVKSIISWDDTKYINIWVVEDIDVEIGAAAYTYLPGTLWGNEIEGIIINHEYVGSIGTSSNTPYKRHTLSHEIGHYFNLSHTWGYGSNGEEENCGYDDDVSDTPNTIGAYSTCNLAQETCGSLDNIQNIMDYSSCTCMFTNGQVDRMHACLSSGYRNNLWSNSNLWDTGTHPDYNNSECEPIVDFFISPVNRICASSPIQFMDNSPLLDNNIDYSWSFVGAEPDFSLDKNPIVVYPEAGEYDVTLNIITDDGTNSITKTYTVYNSSMNLTESFQNTSFPINNDPSLSWSIIGPETETSWARTPISSTSTTGSVRIRSRFFDCYKTHYLYTPNLDLINFGLGVGEPLKIWFDLAYGKRNNDTDDLLVISYSKDCGKTWQVRASWDTDALITTSQSTVGNNFIPNNSEWEERSVNIQAAAGENDVIIRFEFSGDRGSYLYIDNVRLTGEWIDIDELSNSQQLDIINTIDLLGRKNTKSKLQINIYNDGSVNKIYKID